MKDKVASRKHRKSLVRNKIVAQKKVEKAEKKKLSEKQIDQAMENMGVIENLRRIAVLNFLGEQGFSAPKKFDKKDDGKAVFMKKRKKYILSKLDLSQEIMEKLTGAEDQVVGMHAIVAVKNESKGLIFQVFYSSDENKYFCKVHITGDDIPKQKTTGKK